eukprot:398413_1
MTLFVDPAIAKQFECAICFEIYKEPVQIGCEDHIFCKQCANELVSTQGRSFECPLCRKKCSANGITRVKFIDRQINGLKIKCPNAITAKKCIAVGTEHTNTKMRRSKRLKDQTDRQNNRKRTRSISDEDEEFENNHNKKRRKLNEIELSEKCEWKGLYSELDKHIKICALQPISCQYCTDSMLQKELEKHYETCPVFPMQCVQCNKTKICRNKMASHISRYCQMTLINCNKCKQQIKRKDKQLHLKNVCSESLIECPFYRFGCMDKLRRKNEKNHIENGAFTHCHLIANHQLQLEKTVNVLKNENEKLQITNDALYGRINSLENKQELFEKTQTEMNLKIIGRVKKSATHFDGYHIVYARDNGKLYRYQKDEHKLHNLGRLPK